MRRLVPLALVLCLLAEIATSAAAGGNNAKYVGGTIATLQENTDGKIELADKTAVFTAKKGARLSILYEKINSLEYGQKAGRRLGLGVTISPLFLLSKKRKHFLTIGFTDESGKTQGVVFELAKGAVRETLSTLETKSGKKTEYESDQARNYAEKH